MCIYKVVFNSKYKTESGWLGNQREPLPSVLVWEWHQPSWHKIKRNYTSILIKFFTTKDTEMYSIYLIRYFIRVCRCWMGGMAHQYDLLRSWSTLASKTGICEYSRELLTLSERRAHAHTHTKKKSNYI